MEYRHLPTGSTPVGPIPPVASKRDLVVSLSEYTLSKMDMIRFRRGIQLVAKLHFAAGAKAVIPYLRHALQTHPDQVGLLDDAPLDRAYVAVLSHLFGGCVMELQTPTRRVIPMDACEDVKLR